MHPEAYDPKAYGKAGFERVKDLTIGKMSMCMLESD